jgi:hypothetical protein
MRSSLLVVLLLAAGCGTPAGDTGTDPGDTDTGGDTDLVPATDRDDDGYPVGVDCDESRADVNPGVTADICNGRDDDCDGLTDEDPDLSWFLDTDGDGFGKAGGSSFSSCDPGASAYATNDADCDDTDPAIFPGADEVCDGADNDCNGDIDENESEFQAFYADADGDGAGTPDAFVYGCDAASSGGSDNALDCDDTDPHEPVFVSTEGSSRGTGRIDAPLASVQRGIEAATECVLVGPGTYSEDLDFAGRNITVEGLSGSAETIIQGSGRAPVVTFNSGEVAVLRGFTLTGGGGRVESSTGSYWDGTQYVNYYYDYSYGGGVYSFYSYPTLEDVVLADNVLPNSYSYYVSSTEYYYGQGMGGGLYAYGGEVVLTDVDFLRDSACSGGALYHDGDGTIVGTRVRMLENGGQYGTLYQSYTTEKWENLVMDANTTEYGYAGIYTVYGDLRVTNATLVSGEYGIYNYGSAVNVTSSIVNGNITGLYDGGDGTSTWDIRYSDIYGNDGADYYGLDAVTGLDGNVSVPPGFYAYVDNTDADDDDLTLSTRSRLIDAGDPDSARNDGDGSRNDMGAFGGPNGSW